ncbi:MAG: hypothetical protein WA626_19210, partial [Acidobacteriaceae bacterium]
FSRTLCGIAIAVVLVGVSPAQTTSPAANSTGPFGFTCGASRQAISTMVGPLKEEGINQYSTATAPTPFPNVGYYLLTISPTQGLLKIAAETNDIDTDATGADLINQFHTIEAELIKQYGKPTRQEDSLKPGSIWAGEDEWMLSYMKKERTLASHWVFTPANHCVTSIDLTAEVANQTTGDILIGFDFNGYVPAPESPGKKKNAAMEMSK